MGDVVEWVFVQDDEVGEFVDFEVVEVMFEFECFGFFDCGDVQCFEWCYFCCEGLYFEVYFQFFDFVVIVSFYVVVGMQQFCGRGCLGWKDVFVE